MERGQLDQVAFAIVFLKGQLWDEVGKDHSGPSLGAS
jgi:hypothetical protein